MSDNKQKLKHQQDQLRVLMDNFKKDENNTKKSHRKIIEFLTDQVEDDSPDLTSLQSLRDQIEQANILQSLDESKIKKHELKNWIVELNNKVDELTNKEERRQLSYQTDDDDEEINRRPDPGRRGNRQSTDSGIGISSTASLDLPIQEEGDCKHENADNTTYSSEPTQHDEKDESFV